MSRPGQAQAQSAPAAPKAGALSVKDLASLLSRCGGREISAASIQADLEAGAPANADGTMNVVHYGAWLVRKAAEEAGAH